MTALQANNRMLAWISEQAVAAVGDIPASTRAQTMLDTHSTRIQSNGFSSNKRCNVTYTADVSGYYNLASTILRADPTSPNIGYIQRGLKMYDPKDGTDVFTVGATIKLDTVEELDWTDLPIAAQEFILMSATLPFILQETGDDTSYSAARVEFDAAELAFAVHEESVDNANMVHDNHTVSAAGNRWFNP